MSKHTPGPWESFEDEDGSSNPSISVDAQDWGIVCDLGGGKLGMRRANARLIAAAPELLEVALRYEAWEAKLILCGEAWGGGMAPLPTLTQELWDELLEIQRLRNEAKGKAEKGPAA